jgi:S-adenosylmethionine-diacylglycerol 3-amino-3-carboxypropyl transferase
MLTGRYPVDVENGVPPYLARRPEGAWDDLPDRLVLADASFGDYLATCPDGSVDGFALSNIGEWLDEAGLDALFAQIVRTAAPGARLVFRNFVGWTEVPPRWRDVVVEDVPAGEALIARDRSLMQRRIAVCAVGPAA